MHKRIQGCLCFNSESSCVLIDLPSLQTVWACTSHHALRVTVCVLFSVLQRQQQDVVYSWPPLFCCCYIPSVSIKNSDRGNTRRGGSYEGGGREIYFIWLLWELNLSQEEYHKLVSGGFFVCRWQWEENCCTCNWGCHDANNWIVDTISIKFLWYSNILRIIRNFKFVQT